MNKLSPPHGKNGLPSNKTHDQYSTNDDPILLWTLPDGTPLPKVSIITPSFNQGQFIEETIRSVLLQGYPNMEHIIVDGCSTDNTLQIIKKYDEFCTWICEPDSGQSDALNKGFNLAKGSIIGWLNSDDYYEPNAIRTIVEYFLKNPNVEMIYGDCNYVDETAGKKVVRLYKSQEFDFYRLINEGCFIAQPAAFFRRDILFDVSLINSSLQFAMDYDLWIKMGKITNLIQYLPTVLANFRISDVSKSGTMADKFWAETRKVSRRHGGRFFSPMYISHWKIKLAKDWPSFYRLAQGFKILRIL